MKYPIAFFWVTLLIGMVVLLHPYFQVGVPDTHDGNNHLVRFANYKIAIKEGQFPPRWAPNLMNQYGYPVFNFNYPLSNILSLPFSILKLPYELIFKILVAGYVVVGAYFVKKWLELFSVEKSGIGIAIFAWLFFPFLASTIYYRGNIGEIAAYGLIPAMLYIAEYARQHRISYKLISSFILLMSGFLLSHNLTVVFFIPLYAFYLALRYWSNWSAWRRLLPIAAISVLLSMWFWLPAVAEMQLTNITSTGLSREYYQHFATIEQLLFSPLQFGYSVPGQIDGLSFSIGLTTVVVMTLGLLLTILTLIRSQKLNETSWLLFGSSLAISVLAFLQTNYSVWMWQLFSVAEVIQFPWRLSIYIGVLTALGAYLLWRENSILIKALLVGAVVVSIFSTAQANEHSLLHRERIEYDSQSITTDILGENRPRIFSYGYEEQWEPTAKVLSGEADVSSISWSGTKRKYTIIASTEAVVVESTAYFQGWETTVSNGSTYTKISYIDDATIKGRIAYKVVPGNYQVTTQFTQNTWPRLTGNVISAAAVVVLLFIFVKKVNYE